MMPSEIRRNSDTHPLRIDSVAVPQGDGRIGITFCPGKKQRYASTGWWDRDLDTDLHAVAAWGASVLVSLIEFHEMSELEVGRLPQRIDAHGLEWCHLPIRDGGVPSQEFEERWAYEGLGLRSVLRRSGRVVVHCRGGPGRAGMIAARLLVELGADPEQAIRSVRRARTGAIETRRQEEHVRGCRALIR